MGLKYWRQKHIYLTKCEVEEWWCLSLWSVTPVHEMVQVVDQMLRVVVHEIIKSSVNTVEKAKHNSLSHKVTALHYEMGKVWYTSHGLVYEASFKARKQSKSLKCSYFFLILILKI